MERTPSKEFRALSGERAERQDVPVDLTADAPLARILEFEHRLALRSASTWLPCPGGFAVLSSRYPLSHFHNRLVVTATAGAPGAGEVIDAADALLGAAGHRHRQVSVVDGALADAWEPVFAAAGYLRQDELVMLRDPGAPLPDAGAARAVPYRVLRDAVVARWRADLLEATGREAVEAARQLADRAELVHAACTVTHHAVLLPDGSPAAHCDLYRDAGVAQVENVLTHHGHERRGHARAVIGHALATALAGDGAPPADLVYLRADAADWPRHFYRRIGFRQIARGASFLRFG
ncbi:GNAT family N-acetyltransferase [Allostreptomyces psammosilenae]|uniref:GNAT superfamily N-acetyltransferase n=1 Tax=Allostreptomyces psammosilenae TaxID=1892865 RepID=A0A852ZR48_9ACTN|nr:hypothetical protein [Allostreptomyces psammosilenae]NYI04873.1 GNAT superfamily N-acetyltransferase [Allostreptomyces psammosilenae]